MGLVKISARIVYLRLQQVYLGNIPEAPQKNIARIPLRHYYITVNYTKGL